VVERRERERERERERGKEAVGDIITTYPRGKKSSNGRIIKTKQKQVR